MESNLPSFDDHRTRRSPEAERPTETLPPPSPKSTTPAGLAMAVPGSTRIQIDSEAVEAPASRGLDGVWRSWLPEHFNDMDGGTPREYYEQSARGHIQENFPD